MRSALATLAILAGGAMFAETFQSGAAARLARARALRCTFAAAAKGEWKSGAPQAETTSSQLTMRFEQIDADEGTARVTGSVGTADIIVKLSSGALHFVQMGNGPLSTTTVWPAGATADKFIAVHSRHEYTAVVLPGFTSRPEQHYGYCTIEE